MTQDGKATGRHVTRCGASRRTPVIIDTDPGCDDATALMLALASPKLDVRLMTSVGGNVPLWRTTRNCLVVERFLHAHVPVARGTSAPGFDESSTAEHVHGVTGLGGWDFSLTDESLLLDEPALDAQVRVLSVSDEPVTIVSIGPLTNVAALLGTRSDLRQNIARVVMMGGAIGRGNMGPYTEFNVGTDPEAAAAVLSSGVPVVMLPLEVADAAVLTAREIEALGAINPVGAAIRDLMGGPEPSRPKMESKPMYDPTTIAYLCKPELFTWEERRVAVELAGTYTRGATVVFTGEPLEGRLARLEATAPAPVRVCTGVDNAGFRRWLDKTIRRWDGTELG